MKKVLLGAMVTACLFCANTSAQAATIFGNNVTWNYKTFNNTTINPNKIKGSFFDYNYASFDWSNAETWAVTNGPNFPYNTDVALQTKINIGDNNVQNLNLQVAVDDSFSLYVNGSMLKETYNDHGASYWNYTFGSSQLDASLFQSGENIIQVLVNDNQHGVVYDMNLTGDMVPVPEPTSMALGILGFAGLLRFRKK